MVATLLISGQHYRHLLVTINITTYWINMGKGLYTVYTFVPSSGSTCCNLITVHSEVNGFYSVNILSFL